MNRCLGTRKDPHLHGYVTPFSVPTSLNSPGHRVIPHRETLEFCVTCFSGSVFRGRDHRSYVPRTLHIFWEALSSEYWDREFASFLYVTLMLHLWATPSSWVQTVPQKWLCRGYYLITKSRAQVRVQVCLTPKIILSPRGPSRLTCGAGAFQAVQLGWQ